MVPQAKGQTLKSVLLFLQSSMEPSAFEAVLSTLKPEERRSIDSGILPTSTFPMSLVNHLTVEGARISGKPLPQFAREAGRFAASEGVRGVYRLFARVLTPEALLSRAAAMWSSMNTAGRMEVVSEAHHVALLHLHDYSSEPVMCMRIVGWIEQLAELGGARNPDVTHTTCTGKGGKVCEWRITW